mmetsp:Transcript_14971/g.34718  ORF Transcript_14971/g.34718 Transcript_14971/m.34718 type:complete len:198 (-) Transcript_14971:729-1322(-)
MESILLVGAFSVVDALGKMLISYSCFRKCSTDLLWKKGAAGEADNASIVPLCDESSPSNSSKIQWNVSSQISTITIVHKSSLSRSVSTDSTHSTFNTDEDSTHSTFNIHEGNLVSGNLDVPSRLSLEMNTIFSGKGEEFVEVKLATSQYYPNSTQLQQGKNGKSKRHRLLGHTKRKQRVRKLVAEDIAYRQRRSGRI